MNWGSTEKFGKSFAFTPRIHSVASNGMTTSLKLKPSPKHCKTQDEVSLKPCETTGHFIPRRFVRNYRSSSKSAMNSRAFKGECWGQV